ncbi:MAG: Imm26 family immunity protein [Blastocatellia bacterium]
MKHKTCKRKRKLPYVEGDWFAVPLDDQGYALGMIARARPRGRMLFGYFIGPRRREAPALAEVSD